MKRLRLAVMALFTFAAVTTVNAQDENNPWAIGFGINTIDVRIHNSDLDKNFDDYFSTQEWSGNTLPSISRISAERYLTKGFTLQLSGSLNKLSSIENLNDSDALYYSIDALAKYDINNLVGSTGWFNPYLGLGAAFQSIDSDITGFSGRDDAMLVGAIGFNTWFNDNLGLNFQSAYKHHFYPTGYDAFQHTVSLVVKFGGKDSDNDGVYDKNDACPETPGLKEFNGCPDADGDGIKDSDDACPQVAGLAAMNGCPDADGDGIADKDDMCPNDKGTKANKGCPDTDGDGVVNKDDKCPEVAGPSANAGCPWPDADNDGVFDKDDKCPQVAGVASNNGCPEVSAKDAELLNFYAKDILFNTNKSTFKSSAIEKLQNVLVVMNKYPTAKFSIMGHTDSVGRASYNLTLSQNRADAVKAYLESKGIDASRLTAKGFGETMPAESNKTRAGRKANRRVEIKTIK